MNRDERVAGTNGVFMIRVFVREEQGQDLVEYTLLLAFVCVASAALFLNMNNSFLTIWTNANVIVQNAIAQLPS